jgi:hypothetical protein
MNKYLLLFSLSVLFTFVTKAQNITIPNLGACCTQPSSLTCDANKTIYSGSGCNSITSNVTGGSGGNITWDITPTAGVSSTSGSGSSTGSVSFSTNGTYSVTFTSTNNSIPSGCSPAASSSCTRTITVVSNPTCYTSPPQHSVSNTLGNQMLSHYTPSVPVGTKGPAGAASTTLTINGVSTTVSYTSTSNVNYTNNTNSGTPLTPNGHYFEGVWPTGGAGSMTITFSPPVPSSSIGLQYGDYNLATISATINGASYTFSDVGAQTTNPGTAANSLLDGVGMWNLDVFNSVGGPMRRQYELCSQYTGCVSTLVVQVSTTPSTIQHYADFDLLYTP